MIALAKGYPLLVKGYPLLKGGAIYSLTLWVIGNHQLTVTERALIVAAVAGLLGVVQVVLGQLIAGHFANRAADRAEEIAKIAADKAEEVAQRAEQVASANRETLQRLEAMQEEQTGKLNTIKEQTNGS